MKNKLLLAGAVLLSVCSVGVFALITYGFLYPDNHKIHYFTYFEIEAYFLCGLCYLMFYHLIIKKTNCNKSKILMGAGASFITTAQVILLNNLWNYIKFNEMFNWIDPPSYIKFIINDFSYTQCGNWSKYPMVFAMMFTGCLFDAFLLRKTIDLYKEVLFGDIIIIRKEDLNGNSK